jgi:lipoprotein-anchoring transpeptidase ErfK/SrfK
MATELANGETGWVRADDVSVDGVAYALRASLAERALEVRRRGRVVRRITVAIGAPQTPTPTGRFAVTDKLEVTGESPYGCCALAFTGHQPRVPQEWSGGDRLAVHGTTNAASIGDAASLGCLRAGAEDMRWLIDRVPLGTVVRVVP